VRQLLRADQLAITRSAAAVGLLLGACAIWCSLIARGVGRTASATGIGTQKDKRPVGERPGHRGRQRRTAGPQRRRQHQGQDASPTERSNAAGKYHPGPEPDGQRSRVHPHAEGRQGGQTTKHSAAQNSALPSDARPQLRARTNNSPMRCVLAQALTAAFRLRPPGNYAQPPTTRHLQRRFLDIPGEIISDPAGITVKSTAAPTHQSSAKPACPATPPSLVGPRPAPLPVRLTQGPKYRCGNPR
jgi:hypothetical protein